MAISIASLITVFLRYEPSTDPVFKGVKADNVVVYRDRECTQPMAFFSPWHSRRPNKRSRRVMLNCYWWRVEWV